jgi:hypothetical protein
MHRSLIAVLGLALCAGLGAPAAFADTSALGKFPGAKQAIMSYYAHNAREGGGKCNAGQMADIGDARVVSASGDTAVVAVDYNYSAMSNAGTNACSGMGSREFTLAKNSTGWGVAEMSGNQP